MAKSNFLRTFKNYGLRYSLNRAYQVLLRRPIAGYDKFLACVRSKRGLEVGGPSAIFRSGGLIPIYDEVGSLDNCNFGAHTLWADHAPEEFVFSKARPAGRQYFTEGANLSELGSDSYDFVLSSHMLEHSANPLKVVRAWWRVLREGGHLILLVPDRRWTFDHKRPVTAMSHLIDDLNSDMSEADLTHLPEILKYHDLARDPDAGTFEAFRERSKENHLNRGLHQHVFDVDLVSSVLRHERFSIHLLRTAFKDHIIAIGQKQKR